jgi:hypothetical protein
LIDGCAVVGRFAVRRHVDATTVAALAAGRRVPVLRERAAWTARTTARRAAPGLYLRARSALLSTSRSGGVGARAAP